MLCFKKAFSLVCKSVANTYMAKRNIWCVFFTMGQLDAQAQLLLSVEVIVFVRHKMQNFAPHTFSMVEGYATLESPQ